MAQNNKQDNHQERSWREANRDCQEGTARNKQNYEQENLTDTCCLDLHPLEVLSDRMRDSISIYDPLPLPSELVFDQRQRFAQETHPSLQAKPLDTRQSAHDQLVSSTSESRSSSSSPAEGELDSYLSDLRRPLFELPRTPPAPPPLPIEDSDIKIKEDELSISVDIAAPNGCCARMIVGESMPYEQLVDAVRRRLVVLSDFYSDRADYLQQEARSVAHLCRARLVRRRKLSVAESCKDKDILRPNARRPLAGNLTLANREGRIGSGELDWNRDKQLLARQPLPPSNVWRQQAQKRSSRFANINSNNKNDELDDGRPKAPHAAGEAHAKKPPEREAFESTTAQALPDADSHKTSTPTSTPTATTTTTTTAIDKQERRGSADLQQKRRRQLSRQASTSTTSLPPLTAGMVVVESQNDRGGSQKCNNKLLESSSCGGSWSRRKAASSPATTRTDLAKLSCERDGERRKSNLRREKAKQSIDYIAAAGAEEQEQQQHSQIDKRKREGSASSSIMNASIATAQTSAPQVASSTNVIINNNSNNNTIGRRRPIARQKAGQSPAASERKRRMSPTRAQQVARVNSTSGDSCTKFEQQATNPTTTTTPKTPHPPTHSNKEQQQAGKHSYDGNNRQDHRDQPIAARKLEANNNNNKTNTATSHNHIDDGELANEEEEEGPTYRPIAPSSPAKCLQADERLTSGGCSPRGANNNTEPTASSLPRDANLRKPNRKQRAESGGRSGRPGNKTPDRRDQVERVERQTSADLAGVDKSRQSALTFEEELPRQPEAGGQTEPVPEASLGGGGGGQTTQLSVALQSPSATAKCQQQASRRQKQKQQKQQQQQVSYSKAKTSSDNKNSSGEQNNSSKRNTKIPGRKEPETRKSSSRSFASVVACSGDEADDLDNDSYEHNQDTKNLDGSPQIADFNNNQLKSEKSTSSTTSTKNNSESGELREMPPKADLQPKQKLLANDHEASVEELQAGEQATEEAEQQAVESSKPVNNRSILILREIEPSTAEEAVRNIFDSENCPSKPIHCELALRNSWYVTFASDEEASQALAYIRKFVVKWNGQPIMARYKPKPATASPNDVPPIISTTERISSRASPSGSPAELALYPNPTRVQFRPAAEYPALNSAGNPLQQAYQQHYSPILYYNDEQFELGNNQPAFNLADVLRYNGLAPLSGPKQQPVAAWPVVSGATLMGQPASGQNLQLNRNHQHQKGHQNHLQRTNKAPVKQGNWNHQKNGAHHQRRPLHYDYNVAQATNGSSNNSSKAE